MNIIKFLNDLEYPTLYGKNIMVRTIINPEWRKTNFKSPSALLNYLKHNPVEIKNYKVDNGNRNS